MIYAVQNSEAEELPDKIRSEINFTFVFCLTVAKLFGLNNYYLAPVKSTLT